MRINFYDARIIDDGITTLVKEKGTNYETLMMNSPQNISLMMRTLLHMDELAEEHCYMIALNCEPDSRRSKGNIYQGSPYRGILPHTLP